MIENLIQKIFPGAVNIHQRGHKIHLEIPGKDKSPSCTVNLGLLQRIHRAFKSDKIEIEVAAYNELEFEDPREHFPLLKVILTNVPFQEPVPQEHALAA